VTGWVEIKWYERQENGRTYQGEEERGMTPRQTNKTHEKSKREKGGRG
jgi:hypothetical protein